MHRVLQIPEVLLNIFGNIVTSGLSTEDCKIISRDLAALARTCRTFKEPALDILWSELDDPSPLSWCLSEISYQEASRNHGYGLRNFFFTRSLEKVEWDILRSYTRRVWRIRSFRSTWMFDWNFLRDLTPGADLLFPNLRSLHCTFYKEIMPFLHLPFPSLTQLDIHFILGHGVDPSTMLQNPLKLLVETSPKIKKLDIRCSTRALELSKITSDNICSWSNLQAVTCPGVFLNVDAVVHLSRMPSLTQLTFTLSDKFLRSPAPSDSLSLPTLKYLKLHAESLSPVSRLLSWIRLPAITDFIVITNTCPFKRDLATFMASVQIAGLGHTVQEFNLQYPYKELGVIRPRPTDAPSLNLDDLRSCLAFQNLRRMKIDLNWNVDLSNEQLLALGSEWPRLQEFAINPKWGWNSQGGITPLGLAQLLEMCPSLTSIALAINTRGFIKAPAEQPWKALGLSSFEGPFRINVIDSAIEQQSVDAMVAFLVDIVPHFHFARFEYPPYRERWEIVYARASRLIKKRTLDLLP